MNKEQNQNIDDVLMSLKRSYVSEVDSSEELNLVDDVTENIDDEELQTRLMQMFGNEGTKSDSEAAPELYNIDEDFVMEAQAAQEEQEEQLDEEAEEVIGEQIEDVEENIEALDETPQDDEPPFDMPDDEPPFDMPDIELLCPSETEETEDIEEIEIQETEEVTHNVEEIELFDDSEGQLKLFESSQVASYSFEEDETSAYEQQDENQIALDFGDLLGSGEEQLREKSEKCEKCEKEFVDESLLRIIVGAGDGDTLEKNINQEQLRELSGDIEKDTTHKIVEEEAFAYEGEEYVSQEQRDALCASYRKEKRSFTVRCICCALFGLLLILMDMLPALRVVPGGFLNYSRYPLTYELISLQLLIFCILTSPSELWRGLVGAFCLKTQIWSIAALVSVSVLIYDVIAIILSPSALSAQMGSLAATYIFAGLLCECINVRREIKTFTVYSSDAPKFTLTANAARGTAAEKMYRGGVPSSKNIFEPSGLDFPHGYFASVNSPNHSDKLLNSIIIPIVFVGALLCILCVMGGAGEIEAAAIFAMSISLISPLSLFFTRTFPFFLASSRLYERDCAIASFEMAKKYSGCDILVFEDSHLFRPSSANENGIVIYDKKNTRTVIEYLDAIYRAIGGPMCDVFSGVSGTKHTVKLTRIARNGVEAIIDGKRGALLGDFDFLHRFGISVPNGDANEVGIVCLALDGKVAAKLNINYKTEPIFEMLVEQMNDNGISCAIKTYDPVINSEFVSRSRGGKTAPVNVVHMNANDYYYTEKNTRRKKKTGLVVNSSRLKLVESVIWCKRVCRATRRGEIIGACASLLLTVALFVLYAVGAMSVITPVNILIVHLVAVITCLLATRAALPGKKYFTGDK